MREEEHRESFEIHKKTIFAWALEIEGLEKSKKIIGLHAARAINDMLSLFLHKKKLVSEGFQLNHRGFKSEKVSEKLPDFQNKEEIINQKNDAPPHLKRWGLNRRSFFGCSEILVISLNRELLWSNSLVLKEPLHLKRWSFRQVP